MWYVSYRRKSNASKRTSWAQTTVDSGSVDDVKYDERLLKSPLTLPETNKELCSRCCGRNMSREDRTSMWRKLQENYSFCIKNGSNYKSKSLSLRFTGKFSADMT